jgi:hypothetical protein
VELAPVLRGEETGRSLLRPGEKPCIAIREDAVGRVLGLVQRDSTAVTLEQVYAVDGHAPGRGQGGYEKQRRQPPRRDDLREPDYLLAEVAPERTVPAQDQESVRSARERRASSICRRLQCAVCGEGSYVRDQVNRPAFRECLAHARRIPAEKHAHARQRLGSGRIVVEDDHRAISRTCSHLSYSHTR